jgi:CRP/FNR family transcriptional regulator
MENLDKRIQALGTKKFYGKDALLFLPQEEARGFFYILDGEVRVYRMDNKGKDIEIVRLHPGSFFGEAVAFAGGVYPAFARTVKPSEVLFFDTQAVFRKLREDPSIARFFLVLLANKCLVLNERIETLGLRTVRQRLAQYLLSHCPGEEKACLVELKIKKTDLARLLGTISETLSRNLRKLREDGLIEVEGKKIIIKDCHRLRRELPG